MGGKAVAFYTAFDKLLISGALLFEFNIGSLSADGSTACRQSARKITDTGNPENQYRGSIRSGCQ